jgi:hypothetical protein
MVVVLVLVLELEDMLDELVVGPVDIVLVTGEVLVVLVVGVVTGEVVVVVVDVVLGVVIVVVVLGVVVVVVVVEVGALADPPLTVASGAHHPANASPQVTTTFPVAVALLWPPGLVATIEPDAPTVAHRRTNPVT